MPRYFTNVALPQTQIGHIDELDRQISWKFQQFCFINRNRFHIFVSFVSCRVIGIEFLTVSNVAFGNVASVKKFFVRRPFLRSQVAANFD
jgi:hypothetical protein